MKEHTRLAFFNQEAALSLPSNIFLGTSSWNYPGWKGQVYQQAYNSEKEFKEHSLREYASHSLFRTVGIDRTFYTPPSRQLLSDFEEQTPHHFRWVSKVWERITIPKYPKHPRYGKQAGLVNSDFLNPDLFCSEVLAPYDTPEIAAKTGPFVFQFPTIWPGVMEHEEFLEKLERFARALPSKFSYATEIRNSDWLSPKYFSVLNQHRISHCFNHWERMPSIKEQMKASAAAGGLKASFYICRILTPLGLSYQNAVKRFQPYSELQAPLPEMRRDVLQLVRRAIKKNVAAFVIVNNRSEGNSPLTLDALSNMIASERKN